MRKQLCLYSVIVFLSILLTDCSKEPYSEDYLREDETEINGFHVHWRAYMSETQRIIVSDILNDMVFVEGGIFAMGASQLYDQDARPDEAPVHYVKLTDYYICAHELTYDQIVGLVPQLDTRTSDIRDFNGKYLYYSWEDWNYVLQILKDLTKIEFSFPTEAQWEYAAKGGIYSKGYLYPGSDDWNKVYVDDINSSDNAIPNELGLYNMASHRSEWCADAYAEYTDGPMQENPLVTNGKEHVVRGGCHVSTGKTTKWTSSSNYYSNINEDYRFCRSTARSYCTKSWDISCRPVINIK